MSGPFFLEGIASICYLLDLPIACCVFSRKGHCQNKKKKKKKKALTLNVCVLGKDFGGVVWRDIRCNIVSGNIFVPYSNMYSILKYLCPIKIYLYAK